MEALVEAMNKISASSEETENIVKTIEDIAFQTNILSLNAAVDAILQVTIGVEQISTVVQSNSATAEQTAAASEELNAQAESCKNLISQFTLRDD